MVLLKTLGKKLPMLKNYNAQKWYLACIIYRNYYNDKTNLCGYKFDCKISKTEKKITKIARTVIKVFSYSQKASLFGNSKIFL